MCNLGRRSEKRPGRENGPNETATPYLMFWLFFQNTQRFQKFFCSARYIIICDNRVVITRVHTVNLNEKYFREHVTELLWKFKEKFYSPNI